MYRDAKQFSSVHELKQSIVDIRTINSCRNPSNPLKVHCAALHCRTELKGGKDSLLRSIKPGFEICSEFIIMCIKNPVFCNCVFSSYVKQM